MKAARRKSIYSMYTFMNSCIIPFILHTITAGDAIEKGI